MKRAPVLNGLRSALLRGTISWEEHLEAWEQCQREEGQIETPEEVAYLGGFDRDHLALLLGRSSTSFQKGMGGIRALMLSEPHAPDDAEQHWVCQIDYLNKEECGQFCGGALERILRVVTFPEGDMWVASGTERYLVAQGREEHLAVKSMYWTLKEKIRLDRERDPTKVPLSGLNHPPTSLRSLFDSADAKVSRYLFEYYGAGDRKMICWKAHWLTAEELQEMHEKNIEPSDHWRCLRTFPELITE